MRIAVTGSSGRLGSVVVRDLLAAGHDVIPIDLRPAPPDPAIPATRTINCATGGPDLLAATRGADALCHLGNHPTFGWLASPAEGFANNVNATYNVFDAAERNGVGRIIYASSIQSYGLVGNAFDPRPNVARPLYLPVDEDHPREPREAYALSKATGEWVADSFCRRRPALLAFSLRFTAIRTPSPVPPRPAAAPPHPIVGTLLTYVHVQDAARAVRLCCQLGQPPAAGHVPLNIVAPRASSPWSRAMLQDAYGTVPDFRRPLEPTDALISGDRARQTLGFGAELPIPDR